MAIDRPQPHDVRRVKDDEAHEGEVDVVAALQEVLGPIERVIGLRYPTYVKLTSEATLEVLMITWCGDDRDACVESLQCLIPALPILVCRPLDLVAC